MTIWLGVVSAAHVRKGVDLGIVQIGHGKHAGLARMHSGDTIVMYSPTENLGDKTPLRHFTALGTLPDDEIWQAEDGDFRPFRRRVSWHETIPVSVETVRDELALTQGANWGYQLRRGLIPLSEGDLAILTRAMTGAVPPKD